MKNRYVLKVKTSIKTRWIQGLSYDDASKLYWFFMNEPKNIQSLQIIDRDSGHAIATTRFIYD